MNARVLIVDDQVRVAEVIATALAHAGYQCETFSDGASALRAVEERSADTVVTDWKMGGMDGIELLRELRRRRPELPVILLTAYGSVSSAVAAMREGAFDYITKPFDNEELRATVARAGDDATRSREPLSASGNRQPLFARYDYRREPQEPGSA